MKNNLDRNCFNCIHNIVCHGKILVHEALQDVNVNFDNPKLTPMLYKDLLNNIFKLIAMTCIEYIEKESNP